MTVSTSNLHILDSTEKSKQWPQYLAVISACICSLSVGLNFGWSSPYISQMLSPDFHIRLTTDDTAYIAVIVPLGYLIGAPFSAYFGNRIGRKKTLLIVVIPQFIAWIVLGLSNSFAMFLVGRIIAGIPEVAVFTLVPMYMGEVCEPKVRGFIGVSFSLSMILGNFIINLLGAYTTVSQGSFICAICPIIFALTFVWMPESPYFLIMKNRIQEARLSLQKCRRMKNVEPELALLVDNVKSQLSMGGGKLSDLFTDPFNLKAFLILMGLRTVQQMSGLAAFGLYGQKIFADAGSELSPTASQLIIIGVQTLMTFTGSLFVDKLGRRPLFLGSAITTCVILAIMSTYFYIQQHNDIHLNWLPVTGMVVYVLVMSVGLGVVPNLMMSELLSASIKAKALAVSNLVFGLVYSSSSKVFQILQDNVGLWSPFTMYSICCLFGFIFAFVYMPETKGKTLDEIQQEMRKPKKSNKVSFIDVKT